ncbi:MAG: hypothetical protein QM535_08110 [Limnohabitans sp.]|nr:hypothetical protein [Limnohabitans sp.]
MDSIILSIQLAKESLLVGDITYEEFLVILEECKKESEKLKNPKSNFFENLF